MDANTTQVVCDNKKCKNFISGLWGCNLKTITLRNGACSNAVYDEGKIENNNFKKWKLFKSWIRGGKN